MDKILDFQSRFSPPPDFTIVDFAIGQARSHGLAIAGPTDETCADVWVNPEVNAMDLGGLHGLQGRWIACCPFCAGCEYIDFRIPFFFCCSCLNRAVAHKWCRVRIPTNKHRIETILLRRPAGNRNFKSWQSVEDLQAENEFHGIPQAVVSGG